MDSLSQKPNLKLLIEKRKYWKSLRSERTPPPPEHYDYTAAKQSNDYQSFLDTVQHNNNKGLFGSRNFKIALSRLSEWADLIYHNDDLRSLISEQRQKLLQLVFAYNTVSSADILYNWSETKELIATAFRCEVRIQISDPDWIESVPGCSIETDDVSIIRGTKFQDILRTIRGK
jgi:hypothetical protein